MSFKFQLGKCCGCGNFTDVDFNNSPPCESSDCEPGIAVEPPLTAQDYANLGMPCTLMLVYQAQESSNHFVGYKSRFNDQYIKSSWLLSRLIRDDGSVTPFVFNGASVYQRYESSDVFSFSNLIFRTTTDYWNNETNPIFVVNPVVFWKYLNFKEQEDGEYNTQGAVYLRVTHSDTSKRNPRNESFIDARPVALERLTNLDTQQLTNVYQCILPRVYTYGYSGDALTKTLQYNPYLNPKGSVLIYDSTNPKTIATSATITYPLNASLSYSRYIDTFSITGAIQLATGGYPDVELEWQGTNAEYEALSQGANPVISDLNEKLNACLTLPTIVANGKPCLKIDPIKKERYLELTKTQLTKKATFSIPVYVYVYTYVKDSDQYVESAPIFVANLVYELDDVACEVTDKATLRYTINYDKQELDQAAFNAISNFEYDATSNSLRATVTTVDNNVQYSHAPQHEFQKRLTVPIGIDGRSHIKINSITNSTPPRVEFSNQSLRRFESILSATTISFDGTTTSESNIPVSDGLPEGELQGVIGQATFSKGISVEVSGDAESHVFQELKKNNEFVFSEEALPTEPGNPIEEEPTEDGNSQQDSQPDPTTNSNNDEENDEEEDEENDDEDEHYSYFKFAYGYRLLPNPDGWYYDAHGNAVNPYVTETAKPDSSFLRHTTASFEFTTTANGITAETGEDRRRALCQTLVDELKDSPNAEEVSATINFPDVNAQYSVYYFDKAMTRTNGIETYEIPLEY